MDKFYRLMLLLIFAALCVSDVEAQWNEDRSENLLISKSEYGALDLVQVGKTADDKIFISWLSWENQNGFIKLQLLDKYGNALLPEGGMYVSKQPTPTWSSGYGFAITQDGCAVIVNSDTRNSHWQPYAYKISQTGEQLWGEAGIPLLKENEGDGLNPHICITKSNNVLVGFQNIKGAQIDVKIMKLQESGTLAWGGWISLSGANGIFDMVPSGSDGMIVSYFEASTSNYLAMKYTANGEEAWEDKVPIDDSGLVKTTAEPSVITDGADGIITGWRYAVSQFGVAGKAQRVDAKGKKHFGDEGILLDELPVISTDLQQKSLYTAYSIGPKEGKTISINQYDEKGDLKWHNKDVSSEVANQFAIYGIVPLEDGVVVVYRNASAYNEATVEYTKLDLKGKVVESNVVISDAAGDKGRGGLAILPDQFVVIWPDNASSIFAQNVKMNTGSSIANAYLNDKKDFMIYAEEHKTFTMRLVVGEPAEANLSIIDMQGKSAMDLGKIVLNEGINEHSFIAQALSTGIYMLVVHTTKGNFYGKLVIN